MTIYYVLYTLKPIKQFSIIYNLRHHMSTIYNLVTGGVFYVVEMLRPVS